MIHTSVILLLIAQQVLLTTAFPHGILARWLHYSQDVMGDHAGHEAISEYSPTRPGQLRDWQALSSIQVDTASGSESITTFVDPHLKPATVTLTSLSDTQTPTVTNATQNSPDTTGSLVTTIQTEGHPPVQPFPTSLPSQSEATLQPSTVTSTSGNKSSYIVPPSITSEITVPVATSEVLVTTSTVQEVPQATLVSVTQVSVVETTITSDGQTVTTAAASTSVGNTTATVLVESTLIATITATNTVSSIISSGTLSDILPTPSSNCIFDIGCEGQNLFAPIDVKPPPSNIQFHGDHPVPRLGIQGMTGPIETNKFYFNFFLGDQSFPVFTTPYTLAWSRGGGNAQSWGMAVWQIEDTQKVYGPNNTKITGTPASYFLNPLAIQYMIFGAAELDKSTLMTTDSLQVLSGNVNLAPASGTGSIKFPMVEGMGFVTGIYSTLQPELQSSVFFASVASIISPKDNIYKYRANLADGSTWLIYASSSIGLDPNLELKSSTLLQGVPNWSGSIQIAKLPAGQNESIYDDACGAYPTSGSITGYAKYDLAQYGFEWTKGGLYASNTSLLMFALPHQVKSFSKNTAANVTGLQLQTLTKGRATAVVADYWVMTEEHLPTAMGFAPWRPDGETNSTLSPEAIAAIQKVAAVEASQNMTAQSYLDSMYYSGKALAKFAQIVYVMHELSDQQGLANAALVQLQAAFSVFVENRQPFPLYYDTAWKGIVSSGSYVTGNDGVDFGNSYYNDHHFHYGYFLYAASIIGCLDPSWLANNKDYVNALARDVSNPSTIDQWFPVFRSFDFFQGHSWAKGLFPTSDGKDEESSSEDMMFAYGLKMWGQTIKDPSMEGRGNLMLSILARALQDYFLLDSNNTNQPARFIENKVTGILFENKIDHTTYFGVNPEYIQGIHMIPLLPCSTLSRTRTFVEEEWDTYFAEGASDPASQVAGGWRGILYANLAIINPQAAWQFFTQPSFDPRWIDGGASLTWYLAWSAGLGGA